MKTIQVWMEMKGVEELPAQSSSPVVLQAASGTLRQTLFWHPSFMRPASRRNSLERETQRPRRFRKLHGLILGLSAATLLAAFAPSAVCQEVLDQSYDPSASSARDRKLFGGTQLQSQTITFGQAGLITRVESFLFGRGGSSGSIPFPLYYSFRSVSSIGFPDDSQPAFVEGQFSLGFVGLSTNGQWVSIDLRPQNLVVQKDQKVAWVWGGTFGRGGSWDGSSGNEYGRGENFSKTLIIGLPGQSNPWILEPNSDRAF